MAQLGSPSAAPNPMVGCVLIHPENGFIGEGWHQGFGLAHAEVNAIASVSKKNLISGATAILNLEPCSHYGKTPPCANLLIEKGIAEVIISNTDPNPLVSGKGIELLRSAGIRVETGILEEEGRILNRFFFHAQEMKRPFVCLKWAETADGFIGANTGKQILISSSQSRLLVHKMRSEFQAIMVGRNTLRNDNPLLNLRNWPGRQPVRIVTDPNLELDTNLLIFQDSSAPTWILNKSKEGSEGHIQFLQISNADDIESMLQLLWNKGIHSLLVEGGSRLIEQFQFSGFWEEAVVFKNSMILGEGIKAPDPAEIYLKEERLCGPDKVSVYQK